MTASSNENTDNNCCPPPIAARRKRGDPPAEKKSFLAMVLGVFAALVASACCWLPLVIVGLGASSAGVGAAFDRWRPVMLGLTALFLAIGLYFAYRPQRCAPDSACETVPPDKRRGTRIGLWIAVVLVVGVATFPWWVSLFVPRQDTPTVVAASGPQTETIFLITGMTCPSCALNIQRSLKAIPGVSLATVSYDDKSARIEWSPQLITADALRQQVHGIVQAEGYRVADSQ